MMRTISKPLYSYLNHEPRGKLDGGGGRVRVRPFHPSPEIQKQDFTCGEGWMLSDTGW